jgi:hypothetical protein
MHFSSRAGRCEGETWHTVEVYEFNRSYLYQNGETLFNSVNRLCRSMYHVTSYMYGICAYTRMYIYVRFLRVKRNLCNKNKEFICYHFHGSRRVDGKL